MGFGPSPKELSDDPSIASVLAQVKADQAERFARAAMTGAAYASTLPGVCSPVGFFDPLQLTPTDQDEVRMYREAELAHGRVAMMAAVGFVVQENFHPIFCDVTGPVFQQLDQIIATSNGELAASVLLIAVFFSELNRTRVGWVDSERSNESWRTLRPSYRPGNVGFDPMKVSAKLDEKSFLAMQNKELNNGRLAMVGVAGMSAQELVTGAPIFA